MGCTKGHEPFYFMGRRDVERDKVHDHRPTGWSAKEWFAYQDGVHDEWSDLNPDINTLLAW